MKWFYSALILTLMVLTLTLPVKGFAQTGYPGLPSSGGYQDELEADIMRELEEEERQQEKKEDEVLKEIPPIKMVLVRGGCFSMGDYAGIGDDDERPVHKVCLGDYYIAETEVTQELWEAVMGFNPFKENKQLYDPQHPMGSVSWVWANRFVIKLNERTGRFYRLPTEAEWEYAARERGKKIRWPGTDNEEEIKDYAWYKDNSEGMFFPVKQKKPNALGLYDMAGNVWEWVEDYFDFDYYKTSPVDDPYGPDTSYWRVIRGGDVEAPIFKLRTTYRYAFIAPNRALTIGFRLAE